MSKDHGEEGTRERLLRAAAEILAVKGYEAATVRDICQRAGANVAAVNYYFGGKERLYAAVLEHFERRAKERYPLDEGLAPDATPPQRLRVFIRAMLQRMLGEGDPIHAAHAKLLMLEILDPTPALDPLVEQYFTPCVVLLKDILESLLGEAATHEAVRDGMAGVISQCVFFMTHRALVVRFYPDVTYDAEGLERITDSILGFSLRGLSINKAS